jgi:hypothetical protein
MAGDAMFSKERKTSFLVFVLVSFNSDETNHTESTSIYIKLNVCLMKFCTLDLQNKKKITVYFNFTKTNPYYDFQPC